MNLGLPAPADLAKVLGADVGARAVALIDQRLVSPARDLLARPSKHMRGGLLQLAFDLAGGPASAAPSVARAAEAMELLHTGSLIIDDIEDGSPQRRGKSSVHLLYGLPAALCTGNWLYLWPMRLLAELPLPPDVLYLILRQYHAALELAHYGQALDLSAKIDTLAQSEVAAVCEAVVKLKTGTITALSMRLGAILAGASDATTEALAGFGQSFGMALQNFDDLGNLSPQCEPSKRCEDLRQRKPTAVWSIVARQASAAEFDHFRALALQADENTEPVLAWLTSHGFLAAARRECEAIIAAAFASLPPPPEKSPPSPCKSQPQHQPNVSPCPPNTSTATTYADALHRLRALAETLRHAY